MNTRRMTAMLVLTTLGIVLAGCFNPFDPRVEGRGISTPPPTPNSPSGVLRLFEWAYNNRDFSQYRTVFTDDYRFVFGATDTAGNRYRNQPYTRADELASAQNLFGAASTITLALDKSFVVFPDPRPGMNPTYHKNILTQVQLNIVTQDGGQTNVEGKANFFLVRGDSAAIPADLGVQPDSNRWYIDRWEDQTLAGALALARLDASGRSIVPAAARPAGGATAARSVSDVLYVTWGELKRLYP